MNRLSGVLTVCALLIFSAGPVHAAEPATGQPIQLPQADRSAIEALLGQGVVGAAVPGKPLPNAPNVFPIQDRTWTYRIVGGEQKGTTEQHVLTALKRDASGATARYAVGTKTVYFVRQSANGDLSIVSEQDRNEGVIVRYNPPEPMLISGLQPGASKRISIGVKVYDLTDPSDLTHQGSLDVTYSYVGAYSVTVPAGTYDAALIKWQFKGSVGPANIEDTQYRFFAEGVGMVASVDKKDITAMLVYNDQSKFGKVLVSKN